MIGQKGIFKFMTGTIIYQGESLIDNKNIVVIYFNGSKNTKTGNMAQTYIIRSDIDPLLASKTGEDYSICGNCKHSCLLYTSPSPRDLRASRMPSSA